MFCARCGQQIPDTTEICPLCGREATIKVPPAPAFAMAEVAFTQNRLPNAPALIQGPQGVGGWLLFFCILLTLFGPMAITAQNVTLGPMLYRRYLLDLVRVAYGIAVGIFLWMGRPAALNLLKIYFWLVLVIAALDALGLVVIGLRTGWTSLFLSAGFPRVLQLLAYTMVWFAYFRKSQRVKNTYGANL